MAGNTPQRKKEHLDIVIKENPNFIEKSPGFNEVELVYKTLPEIDLSEVNTSMEFLGKKFSAPLMVSGMTGGTQEAKTINEDIAAACEEVGIGFGVGSQRAMISNPELTDTYSVRQVAPNILIAGNIGITQLKNYTVNQVQKMLEDIDADCLAIHTNAAQEAVQPDGSPEFKGAFSQIEKFTKELNLPVYVKEVGNGISKEAAAELEKTKIAALDVGGSGGTSWTAVEYLRTQAASNSYWDFGIPTSLSVLEAKTGFNRDIIATGGIRNGLDLVKVLVLGASLGGIAAPAIKAQQKGGKEETIKVLKQIIQDLRIGLFLLGAKNLTELKNSQFILLGKTKDWAETRNLI